MVVAKGSLLGRASFHDGRYWSIGTADHFRDVMMVPASDLRFVDYDSQLGACCDAQSVNCG